MERFLTSDFQLIEHIRYIVERKVTFKGPPRPRYT
jgi:hypothetical protein